MCSYVNTRILVEIIISMLHLSRKLYFIVKNALLKAFLVCKIKTFFMSEINKHLFKFKKHKK